MFRSWHTARRGYAAREQFPLLLQFFDPTTWRAGKQVKDGASALAVRQTMRSGLRLLFRSDAPRAIRSEYGGQTGARGRVLI
jgi:hypothetical protein